MEKKAVVLLVDDVPQNLQVLASYLSEEYELALATSGTQALEMVGEQPPNLILLDVGLPDIDGFEVCVRLKKMPQTATIPVIFLTARTDTNDIVKGFEVGGVDYITKPFKASELKARVRTHVQLHQLKSLLQVCCVCQKIHNENDQWEPIVSYIGRQTGTSFSHGMCPACAENYLAKLKL